MPLEFLHHHQDFAGLLQIVGENMQIDPVLIEKDYWIMHCMYGLTQMSLCFELKGGTSLSKGFNIINRFSEDIDIRIEPPTGMEVYMGKNHDKPTHIESRRRFYDWLSETIKIDGITSVTRDHAFDDVKLRSAGIRLNYAEAHGIKADVKQGVLLEVGFDDVTPNVGKNISSWAYDFAASKIAIIDNRAHGVMCYSPGHTLVEKLQTISTKFRLQQKSGDFPANFMRHYYDVYCLLGDSAVREFIGTHEYQLHKQRRFRSENPDIPQNEAFCLREPNTYAQYEKAYMRTKSLYYREQPAFAEILERIQHFAERL